LQAWAQVFLVARRRLYPDELLARGSDDKQVRVITT